MADSSKDAFDISSFRSTIKTDYHYTSHFHLLIGVPPGLAGSMQAGSQEDFGTTSKRIMFEVEQTNSPGIQLATDEVRRYGMGSYELKPYAPIFNKLNAVVRSDSEGKIYDFFQSWMKLVINYDFRNGIDSAVGFNNSTAFEVAYKKDYVVEAELINYDKQGAEVKRIHLRNFYPVLLNDVQYEWTSASQIVRIPMTFAFSDWYQERKIGSAAPSTGQGSVTIDSVTPTTNPTNPTVIKV